MKRTLILITTLIATLIAIVSNALALDHETFDIYSSLFGANALDDSTANVVNDAYEYRFDGGRVLFRAKDESIVTAVIQGSGDIFLAYCYGALFEFDPDPNHAAENGGQLLGCYLIAHNSEEKQIGFTISGYMFYIKKEEDYYSFIISKNVD